MTGHSVPEAWRTPGQPPRRVAFPEVTREAWEKEPPGPYTDHRFADHHQAVAANLDEYRNMPVYVVSGTDTPAPQMTVYTERAHLVAHLASLHPSVLAYSDPAEPEWPVVTIATPAGQLTWHIAPGDLPLFAHVPVVPADDPRARWDGHTTAVKYRRLAALTSQEHQP